MLIHVHCGSASLQSLKIKKKTEHSNCCHLLTFILISSLSYVFDCNENNVSDSFFIKLSEHFRFFFQNMNNELET